MKIEKEFERRKQKRPKLGWRIINLEGSEDTINDGQETTNA